jgi:predicted exporter
VLSIGVDYAIFLVASGPEADTRAATLLGLCLACASTCLAFGLLAFSSFPALRALGASTAIGAVLSLVMAPTVLLLLGPHEDAACRGRLLTGDGSRRIPRSGARPGPE